VGRVSGDDARDSQRMNVVEKVKKNGTTKIRGNSKMVAKRKGKCQDFVTRRERLVGGGVLGTCVQNTNNVAKRKGVWGFGNGTIHENEVSASD